MNQVLTAKRSPITKRDVFRLIRRHGPMERAALSRELRVSFPTVSRLINELLADRLVREETLGESTGGRKPVQYAVDAGGYCAIGVNIGRKALRTALVDLGGRVLQSVSHRMDATMTPVESVRKIHSFVRKMEDTRAAGGGRVLGLGIAATGPLDRQSGIILNPTLFPPDWSNVPIVEMLRRELDLPILLENQTRAAALAEHWYGGARNMENLVFVLVEYGIGAGIFANGSLIRSELDITSSLGNMIISFERTRSGNEGCGRLEDYASNEAICRRVEEALKRGRKSRLAPLAGSAACDVTFGRILEAYRDGDALCREVIRDAARAFGVALANFTSLIRPGQVILGGEIFEKCEDFFALAVQTAERFIVPKSKNRIPFVRSTLGGDSYIVGAVTQVFSHFLD